MPAPETTYTPEQEKSILAEIGAMTHEQMARTWRFAPCGHPLFRSDLPFLDAFKLRFDQFGGWTPGLSKQIGLAP